MVSREIREIKVTAGVPTAALTGPLDTLEVSILLQEGATYREEASTLHKREDRLQVARRGTCLDPPTGILLEQMKLRPPEGVVIDLLSSRDDMLMLIYHGSHM